MQSLIRGVIDLVVYVQKERARGQEQGHRERAEDSDAESEAGHSVQPTGNLISAEISQESSSEAQLPRGNE